MKNLAAYRKTLVAVASVIGVLISTAAFPANVTHWLTIAVTVLAALGVYAVPNEPQAAPASDASDPLATK